MSVEVIESKPIVKQPSKLCILTFHLNYPVITDPNLIIAYVLRHFVYTPKNVTEHWEDKTISFVYLLALHGNNLDSLKIDIETSLTMVLQNYFPRASIEVDVSFTELTTKDIGLPNEYMPPKDPEPTNFVGCNISIKVHQGSEVYTCNAEFIVNKEKYSILSFKYT